MAMFSVLCMETHRRYNVYVPADKSNLEVHYCNQIHRVSIKSSPFLFLW